MTFDTAKPKLSSVSAKRVAKGAARVRLRVSEDSDVSVASSVTVDGEVRHGVRHRHALADRARPEGRQYTIQVRATDIAGNRSSLRTSPSTSARRLRQP